MVTTLYFFKPDYITFFQVRFNPHDYGTIQEIADEITNIQGIQHESLVKYFGVELHKVTRFSVIMINHISGQACSAYHQLN